MTYLSIMEAQFFPDQQAFRKWLQKNHKTATELLVGFYKVNSGKPSMSWSGSVDQALCFGWIDSVRRSIDGESYCIRFTPRKPSSIWSAVNINKMKVLIAAGLMTPSGIAAFEKRSESRSKIYSHENAAALAPDHVTTFKQHTEAWRFFEQQAPSYKRIIAHWIMSAKQEKTRRSRLQKAITASGQAVRIKIM